MQEVVGQIESYEDGVCKFLLGGGIKITGLGGLKMRTICLITPLPSRNKNIIYKITIKRQDSGSSPNFEVCSVLECQPAASRSTNIMPMPKEYYSALRFFSDAALRKKGIDSLRSVLHRIETAPLSFLFPAEGDSDVHWHVANPVYRRRCFMGKDMYWNCNDLAAASQAEMFDWRGLSLPSAGLLKHALTLWHEFCSLAEFAGAFIQKAPSVIDEPFQYLLNKKILCYPNYHGVALDKNVVTTPCFNQTENTLVALLLMMNVSLISCSFYENVFFLPTLARKIQSLGANVLCCSATYTSTNYLNNFFGCDRFVAVDSICSSERKRSNNEYDTVLIDRAHKIGAAYIATILQRYQPQNVVLVGDITEMPADYHRGGGSVMFSVANSGICEVEAWVPSTDLAPKMPILSAYNGINKGNLHDTYHFAVDKNADIMANIWDIAKSLDSFLIFCSQAEMLKLVRDQYADIVLKTKVANVHTKNNVLMMNHRVFIPKLGVVSPLVKAVLITGDRSEHVHLKDLIRPNVYQYRLTFNDLPTIDSSFLTELFAVESGEIMHCNKFCGAPCQIVFFVVTPKTLHCQILGAMKYAKDKFVLVLTEGVAPNFLATMVKSENYDKVHVVQSRDFVAEKIGYRKALQ